MFKNTWKNFLNFLLLNILLCQTVIALESLASATSTDSGRSLAGNSGEGFWLSTDLLSVEIRKGCLSTAYCHEPKFKLINTMTINSDQSVISWPLNGGEFLQSHARTFVTYWTDGEPEDIGLSCEISGTDPSFGFTRSCDETPQKRIFNEGFQKTLIRPHWPPNDQEYLKTVRSTRHNKNGRQLRDLGGLQGEPEEGRMIVELRGKCFNATLAVRKHLSRCPWCPDPNLHIVVGQQNMNNNEDSGSSESFQQRLFNADSFFLHNCVILALSGAVVIGFSGLFCVLAKHYNYRKSHKKQRKTRNLKFAPLPSERTTTSTTASNNGISHQSSPPPLTQLHKISEPMKGHNWRQPNNNTTTSPHQLNDEAKLMTEEQRYETPWENKFRPFQHWTMTTSSPIGADESHYQQFLHYLQPNVEQLSANIDSLNNGGHKMNQYNTSCNSSSGFNSSTGSGTSAIITIPPTINHSLPPLTLPRRPPPAIPSSEDMIIMGKTSHHQRQHIQQPSSNIITSPMTRHDDSGLESV